MTLGRAPARRSSTTSRGDTAMVEIAFDAAAGRTYTFTQLVSRGDVGRRAEAAGRAPHATSTRRSPAATTRLAADNAAAWARRWETDIVIEGNPELQRVVRSMLFYLLCSADSGTGLGIPPMGLSSGGYYGHIFWDSDTWMFPSLLLTHPDVARSLVAFRARTLGAARANARANGFRGRDVSLGGRRAGARDHAPLRRPERALRDPRHRRRRPGAVAVLPRHRRLRLAGARGLSR